MVRNQVEMQIRSMDAVYSGDGAPAVHGGILMKHHNILSTYPPAYSVFDFDNISLIFYPRVTYISASFQSSLKIDVQKHSLETFI